MCPPASGRTIYGVAYNMRMDLHARIAALTAAPLSQSARRHLSAALARIDRDSQRDAALAAARDLVDPSGLSGPWAVAERIAADIDTLRTRNIARRIAAGTRKASEYEHALLALSTARLRSKTALAAALKKLTVK